jgi:hypothetical protein
MPSLNSRSKWIEIDVDRGPPKAGAATLRRDAPTRLFTDEL